MRYLTDFGDQAVLLPLAGVVAFALAGCRWWRGLVAWLLATTGVLSTMALLKYVCFACAGPLRDSGVVSPSGHTAASAAIYGGGLVLLLRDRVPPAALVVIPPSLAAIFGTTRILLGAHDLPEVFVGASVGLVGAAVIGLLSGPRPQMRVWPGVIGAVVTIFVCHGLRIHGERVIHNFAFFTWLPLPKVCRV